MIEGTRTVPPVVYVPTAGPADELDLRETPDGRSVLLVYTALDRLVEGCGPQQPWVLLPVAELGAEGGRTAPDLILFDVAVPDHARRPGPTGSVPA